MRFTLNEKFIFWVTITFIKITSEMENPPNTLLYLRCVLHLPCALLNPTARNAARAIKPIRRAAAILV